MSVLAQVHDDFFGRIIEMIPVDLYRPKEDNEDDVVAAIHESKYYKVLLPTIQRYMTDCL